MLGKSLVNGCFQKAKRVSVIMNEYFTKFSKHSDQCFANLNYIILFFNYSKILILISSLLQLYYTSVIC